MEGGRQRGREEGGEALRGIETDRVSVLWRYKVQMVCFLLWGVW